MGTFKFCFDHVGFQCHGVVGFPFEEFEDPFLKLLLHHLWRGKSFLLGTLKKQI
jgi:hypothetical protein